MDKQLKQIENSINQSRFDEAYALIKAAKYPGPLRDALNGIVSMKLGDVQQAELLLQQALEANPNLVIAQANLANLYVHLKLFKRALPLAEQAYKAAPKDENFLLTYIACLADSDKYGEAARILASHIESPKPSIKVLNAYAQVLRADLRPKEALAVLERLKSLYPNQAEAEKSMAETYSEIDPIAATEYFDSALRKHPDSQALKWNASFAYLRAGQFDTGWKYYEEGLSEKIGKIGRPIPWQAKNLPKVTEISELDPEKWTLFTSEQGLGDQILFFGCLEEALIKYPKSAIITEDRMVPILRRAFPSIGVYTYSFALALSKQSHRINGIFPIGSLMKHYRTDAESFERHRRIYLYPDEAKVQKYREVIKAKYPAKKLIGLAWKGGHWDRQIRTKSFAFERMTAMFKTDDVRYVCLQYGDISEEKKLANNQKLPITFIDGLDFKKDIDSWFALACACDRIVSVSTALVHFVGAAGKNVDVLLGDQQAPFIWGLKEGKCLPYPNVNLIRKNKKEDLEEFMARVSSKINEDSL